MATAIGPTAPELSGDCIVVNLQRHSRAARFRVSHSERPCGPFVGHDVKLGAPVMCYVSYEGCSAGVVTNERAASSRL